MRGRRGSCCRRPATCSTGSPRALSVAPTSPCGDRAVGEHRRVRARRPSRDRRRRSSRALADASRDGRPDGPDVSRQLGARARRHRVAAIRTSPTSLSIDGMTIDAAAPRARRSSRATDFCCAISSRTSSAQMSTGRRACVDLYAGAGCSRSPRPSFGRARDRRRRRSRRGGRPRGERRARSAARSQRSTSRSRASRRVDACAVRTVLIVDPPRTGHVEGGAGRVHAAAARAIVYVSCDVATLARDARRLVDAGYAIDRVDAFDLFPNTPHVETVVVVRRDLETLGSISGCLFRPRGFEEPFEQRTELAGAPEVLRMPLDAEAEARRGILDRLDDAVGRRGATPGSPGRRCLTA